jgi:cephalosporin-C deacetylase-like acetyl esterase
MRRLLIALSLLLPMPIGAAPAAPGSLATSVSFDEFVGYDSALPLAAEVKEESPGRYHVIFSSAHDARVTARLMLPPGGGKSAAVLLQHGYTGSKDDFAPLQLALAAQGIASLAVDAPYHGERKVAGADIFGPYLHHTRDGLAQAVIDLRRGIDYLQSRPEVDADRIGYLGASMGGILGADTAGADPRLKAVVLWVAGGNWGRLIETSSLARRLFAQSPSAESLSDAGRVLRPVDPLVWVARIAPRPLLMLNGRQDDVVPPPTTEELFAAAREPKEIRWYDSGHNLPVLQAVTVSLQWLKEKLGAATAPGPTVTELRLDPAEGKAGDRVKVAVRYSLPPGATLRRVRISVARVGYELELADDGKDGDDAAADGIASRLITIPQNAPAEEYEVAATVEDSSGKTSPAVSGVFRVRS